MFRFTTFLSRRLSPRRRAQARPARPRAPRPSLEQLEVREVLSSVPPTAVEQVFLERLNDARANPPAYGRSIGLNLDSVGPSQPLAFDGRLIAAARGHSQEMSDLNSFGHSGANGSSPGQRMAAEGYPSSGWAESIAAGYSTPEEALKALIIDGGVPDLGHRVHLLAMNSTMQRMDQVGVGIVQNGSGGYHNYYTIDTGYDADTRPYLTGVAYNDLNHNAKYDAGEGLGGVTINVAGVGSVTTWGSGGYSFQVSPGTYTVTASGPGMAVPVTRTVTVGGQNYRLNFNPSTAPNAPLAQVSVGGTAVADNTGSVDFGTTLTGVPVSRTFTVTNNGLQTLTLGSISVPAGFRLTSNFGTTSLAYGASTTFTIQLEAAAPGNYGGQVSFATNDTTRNPFNFTVTGAVGSSLVLDNGTAAYSETGLWGDTSGAVYGGTLRYASPASAIGPSTAAWQASGLPAGSYAVQATWSAYSNRATNAPYRVYDGNTLVGTFYANQQAGPSGTSVAGVVFQELGKVQVTSGTLKVVLGNDANGIVIADAVRLVDLRAVPPPDVSTGTVLDNGTPAYSETGLWGDTSGAVYGGTLRYASAASAIGPSTATWQATGLAAGTYAVQTTWSAYSNRATNAPYRVYDGNTLVGTFLANQRVSPSGSLVDGIAFQALGTVQISSGTLKVVLSNDADGIVIADAVRFVPVAAPPPGPATVLDNGTPVYSETGLWGDTSGAVYGGTLRYASPASAIGPSTATWQATGLAAGNYVLQATWSAYTNRASNAPYRVYDGNTLVGTFLANQQAVPSGPPVDGIAFQTLGTVQITSGTLKVVLGNDADGIVIADAVRFQPVAI